MRTNPFICILFFLLFTCEQIVEKEIDKYHLIPPNSKAVISIKNLSKFKNSLFNNNYLKTVVNSNSTLTNLISDINRIKNDKEILVGLYGIDSLYYSIIGEKISNDSIVNKNHYSFRNIEIITNNPSYTPIINKNHFINKFKKINQTNSNFSVALDSTITNEFINIFFNEENQISDGNLMLNIDATSNLILLNGVIDNYSIEIDQNNDLLRFEEIKNPERNLYFDFENELLNDYDAISTNQDKKLNIFNFEKSNSNHDNYKIFQFKNGNNVLNINGIISEFKNESSSSEFNLKFEVSLTNEIILGPIIVKNHINNKNEIIVQDVENKLHLINSTGQVEWTKKIDGKIIKEINQIDSYKNGKLQYVFVTEKNLYMLDRKGRDVGKFPLKFNDKITQPISVFDYDKNKNYRLLITQNNELFMFDSKGNRIKGFDYKKKSEIITKPKHFRISNKDIIVFKTKNNLSIINRRGKIRIKPKKDYNYSNYQIFQHDNSLITKTSINEIVEIDMKGNTKIEKSMPFNSKLVSDKNFMFTIEENVISNMNNDKEIPFGKYDDFKIYNINKNVFVSIFDSQNSNSYFLNSKLEMMDGFPISSKSNVDFNTTNNNKIEFSLKSDDRTIKFYSIK